MTAEKVWLRFEKKKKDGTVWKLRIQDLPVERYDEAIDLRVKYFVRDEVVHKAVGIINNPVAVEQYKVYLHTVMGDPACRTVICCEDTGDAAGDIMGVSSVSIVHNDFRFDELMKEDITAEDKKIIEVFHAASEKYRPMKEMNLSVYLDDYAVVVVPDYRGYGIAEQFFKTRRIMCAEFNVPKTGGWMTGYGTQIGAARDGWETVFEMNFDDLAKAHNLVLDDAPPTLKYMVAGPLHEI